MIRTLMLVLVLTLALGLSACGRQPAAEPPPAAPPTAAAAAATDPEPTATEAPPPTATPEPTTAPTATPSPEPTGAPTAAPAVAQAGMTGGEAAALLMALDRTSNAAVYRVQLDASIEGLPPDLAMQFGSLNADFSNALQISGAVNQGAVQMDIGGALMTIAGIDPESGLKLIVHDNQFYLHGPFELLGATEARWYLLPSETTNDIGFTSTDDLRADFDPAEFQPVFDNLRLAGRERIHGQECDHYAADRDATLNIFRAMGAESGADPSQLDGISDASIGMWVCDDGYFHQFALSVRGEMPDLPGQEISFSFELQVFDFNGDVVINPPLDAVALEMPAFEEMLGGSFSPIPDAASAEPAGAEPFAPASNLTATVFNGGNIRAAPHTQAEVLGQLHAAETVALLERSADGVWYHVDAPEASGWVHVSLLTIAPDVAPQVPLLGADPPAAESGAAKDVAELVAAVRNGGNVRAAPNLQGQVLDQVHAYESVDLLARTADGAWYQIVDARGITGWVNASLLTVAPEVAARVPAA